MRHLSPLAFATFAVLLLAGCSSSKSTSDSVGGQDQAPLPPDKGAISGLVIDDRYRPLPAAEVLLLPNGLTTAADGEGQFSFTGLEPGAYEVRVTLPEHESAPQGVDVVAGEYSELEVQARRIFSDSGYIVTLQTSIFIPCAVASPAIVVTVNCLGDLSGDSYRTGFTTSFNSTTTTYLVGEVRYNKVDNYMFILRPSGCGSTSCSYNNTIIHQGDYGRSELKAHNATYQVNTWDPGDKLQATIFFSGQTDGIVAPVCVDANTCVSPDAQNGFGSGATFAIKATMTLSAFIGEPQTDIHAYALLKPSE